MQALESLMRWRRFHPRANVEELKESLIAIGRKDVLNVYVTKAFMYNFELIDLKKSLQECQTKFITDRFWANLVYNTISYLEICEVFEILDSPLQTFLFLISYYINVCQNQWYAQRKFVAAQLNSRLVRRIQILHSEVCTFELINAM